MSNHDLRLLRSNGVEELCRSILPPGVSPNLPLPLLTQLTAAQAAACSAATTPPVSSPAAGLLPPVNRQTPSKTKNPSIHSATSSKAEHERQLLLQQHQSLQQQQLLYLNAVYAQQLQGIASAPTEVGKLRAPSHLEHFLPPLPGHHHHQAAAAATSAAYAPALADMHRRLLLAQNDNTKHLVQQQQQERQKLQADQLKRNFKGAGSAFTPVTPKQKILNARLPMPKNRSASVPLQSTWEPPKLEETPPEPKKSRENPLPVESLVKTPDISKDEQKTPKTQPVSPPKAQTAEPVTVAPVVPEPKVVVEPKVQVNEADSISSPSHQDKDTIETKVEEKVEEDKLSTGSKRKVSEEVPKTVSEEPVVVEPTTTTPVVEETKKDELQSKEVSSSNLPVVSPKPTMIAHLPDQMQPLKKRRLKAVIADTLNQGLDESYSSSYSSRNISPVQPASDSDTLPLAVLRDRLHQNESKPTQITHMKLRVEDHIPDIESSLATFKSHVSTPTNLSSSPSSPCSSGSGARGTLPQSPLATPEKKTAPVRTGSSRRKPRQPSASVPASPPATYSTMDASEMQQLAPYIISCSDSDNDSAESSGDDFHSRAFVDSSERRKTRSPAVKVVPKKPQPKKPGRKVTGKKKWKSEDEDEETKPDDHLVKFFAADAELSDSESKNVKKAPKKKVQKKRKTPEKTEKVEPEPKKEQARKRKSGTPRKLEIIDESKLDSWETAADTEVVKNSSNDSDYLIKEQDPSWYSVTCFCGQPFAGRPMIECDLCGMWVHMTCAKIKKNKVPDHYNCTQCRRDAKAVKTRHRR